MDTSINIYIYIYILKTTSQKDPKQMRKKRWEKKMSL